MGKQASYRSGTPGETQSDASAAAERADQPQPSDPHRNRRTDRRKTPTNPLSLHSLLYGRRRKIRRGEDRMVHYYVDRYGPVSVSLFLLSLAFSTLDASITLMLVESGGNELNPLMRFFLQLGEVPFLVAKFGLTLAGLLFLLVHKEYHLFGRQIRGKHVLGFALGLYAILILYEFTLLRKLWAAS